MRLLAFFASALLLPCIAVPQQPWTLAAGWTQVPAPVQGETIYVSKAVPDGNDGNDGLHPTLIGTGQGPKKTITAGYTALANLTGGRQLLLREGDTFSDPQDFIGNWQLSGTSTADPMVFGSYPVGGPQLARPKIRVHPENPHDAFFASASSGVKYLLVTGIQFECAGPASQNNQLKGIYFIGGGSNSVNEWVRFEDCFVNGWFVGIAIDPYPTNICFNISVRRCVVVDNYRVPPPPDADPPPPPGYVVNSGGLYAEQTNGLLVEECVFDKNGWDGVNYTTRHAQNHNTYIQDDCIEVTVIGNISARGSGDNFQLRPIGTIHKNLSLKSPIHFSMGGDLDPNVPDPPRACDVLGNVALEGDDINPNANPPLLLGWAYTIKNVEPPGNSIATMRYNIAANKDLTSGPNGGEPLGIYLDGGKEQGSQRGIRDFHVHNNVIWNWGAPLEVITAASPPGPFGPGFSNVELHSNDVQEPSFQTLAFRGPDWHAVTGWSSYGNRFNTQKPTGTFMRWYNGMYGSDYVVGLPGTSPTYAPTNGWRQQILTQGGIVDGPPAGPQPSRDLAVTYTGSSSTITTYHQSSSPAPAGTGGLPEFMDACRLQRKGNWRVKYTGLEAVRYFQIIFFGAAVP